MAEEPTRVDSNDRTRVDTEERTYVDTEERTRVDTEDRISVDPENPWYWRYHGERVLLLGGTDTDSLFQWAQDGLADHLDLLVSAGGNYVRNTMSDRKRDYEADDRKRGNVYAFDTVDDGLYDLTEWNEEYWTRLETFLSETAARDVIVELTLWDQHDFSDGLWESIPWNPENNVTYDRDESGLEAREDFFAAVANDNRVVLPHQERFIERVLATSLDHGHVIYNITNEGWAGIEWENHWCDAVRGAADERGVEVHVANMNFTPQESVEKAITHADRYSYVEISQHNQDAMGKSGQAHWDDLQTWRLALYETVGSRPMNNVKIYGSEETHVHAGGAGEAVDRMWRAILGGCASARFHRPIGESAWGIGLNERARSSIRALRTLHEEVDLTEAVGRNDLLVDRKPNAAYCVATADGRYVLYLPNGGSAVLWLPPTNSERRTRWLDVRSGEWRSEEASPSVLEERGWREHVELDSPGEGTWAAVLSD